MTSLPGGSPGPNAYMTAGIRWFLIISGILMACWIYLAMKYCSEYGEQVASAMEGQQEP